MTQALRAGLGSGGRRRWLTLGAAAWLAPQGALLTLPAQALEQAPAPSAGPWLQPPRAQFSLPFHLVNGYILVDAAVGPHAGRFMLDTGTEFPFFFNRHVLPLAKDQFLGRGHAASGQELVLYRQTAPIRGLVLSGGLALPPLHGLPHADFGFLEQAISRRFLGMMGFGFCRDHEFAIDYHQQRIDLHTLPPADAAGSGEPLLHPDPGARLLLALKFSPTGAGGKMPELDVQLGDQSLRASIDTGNLGSLALSPELRERLERQGLLRVAPGRFLHGEAVPHLRASLRGLQIQGVAMAPLHNLLLTVGARNHLGLGYQFLKSYVSVWNYRRQEIRLYEP